MYTQCPECRIAFRVTAKVLQQASGNVRCGSCGHAFNALHYLSEEMPAQPAPAGSEPAGDELAETSRRLLETLNQLAGSEDVRIEDTGVEWRVLEDDAEENGLEPMLSVPAVEEQRYDDNTPLPDDFDGSAEYSSQAAPQRRETDHKLLSDEFESRQGDLALSNPEDWADILDEFRDPEADSLEVEEELAAIHSQLSSRAEPTDAEPADRDTLSDSQAEALGPQFAGADDALTDEVPLLDEGIGEDERFPERIEAAGDFDKDDLENAFEAGSGLIGEKPGLMQAADIVGVEDAGYSRDEEDAAAFVSADEAPGDDAAAEVEALALEGADDEVDTPTGETEHFVPEPTEEEMTVNMEIDAELMAAAKQDVDFTATLVGLENPEDIFEQNPEDVETIIMEGEFIRTAVENERLSAENAARRQLDDPDGLADTYALSREKVRGGGRRYDPPSVGILAATALLALLLVVQYVHNSRQSLATYGFFNQTVAPVYRLFGSSVMPEWDIRGWQFEATNGNVDPEETTLTIVSRIANRSEQALPYPLVHVSLTNRWEDIMGSRILEPGEYLTGDLDPSRPVAPGENFTAVISIENPSAEATGFKLNVCYRAEPGTVRCAIEDFKN